MSNTYAACLAAEPRSAANNRYLDLLRDCIIGSIRPERYRRLINQPWWFAPISKALGRVGFELVRKASYDPRLREEGLDWPANAESMIGRKRMDNLRFCIESALEDRVPGDFIEAGVWRGGAAIFMRGVLKANDVRNRLVWVADSFEGLPAPDPKYSADAGDRHSTLKDMGVSLEEVQRNFENYGLLDHNVRFLKGWFCDTLAKAPIDRLALMRLDGDMYGSTMDSLEALYPRLCVGGYVIIDDYNLPGARQATDDYRLRHGITESIQRVDWTGVYWRRSTAAYNGG